MMALHSALSALHEASTKLPPASQIWIFTDSESTVKRIQGGPGVQTAKLADDVWNLLTKLSRSYKITLQWIPGHKDIDGNEQADVVAKEAAKLAQTDVKLDYLTMKTAIKGHFRSKWRAEVAAQKGIYSQANVAVPPALPNYITRKEEVTIHQIRTGKSPLVRSCWARYAKKPEEERYCQNGCNAKETVRHLFWDCPAYTAQRMKHFGTHIPEEDILFKKPKSILKFLDDTGHSTAPSTEEETLQ